MGRHRPTEPSVLGAPPIPPGGRSSPRLAERDCHRHRAQRSPFRCRCRPSHGHLKVLEEAALISRRRSGKWRASHLETAPLQEAADWIDRFRRSWKHVPRPSRRPPRCGPGRWSARQEGALMHPDEPQLAILSRSRRTPRAGIPSLHRSGSPRDVVGPERHPRSHDTRSRSTTSPNRRKPTRESDSGCPRTWPGPATRAWLEAFEKLDATLAPPPGRPRPTSRCSGMATLIYLTNVSLDGYIEDAHGAPRLGLRPDGRRVRSPKRPAEIRRHVSSTGGRLYETMGRLGETTPALAEQSDLTADFREMPGVRRTRSSTPPP